MNYYFEFTKFVMVSIQLCDTLADTQKWSEHTRKRWTTWKNLRRTLGESRRGSCQIWM